MGQDAFGGHVSDIYMRIHNIIKITVMKWAQNYFMMGALQHEQLNYKVAALGRLKAMV